MKAAFAPNLKSADEALGFYLQRPANVPVTKPGEDVTFALDCASTEFYKDGIYDLEGEGKKFDAAQHGANIWRIWCSPLSHRLDRGWLR